MPLSAVQQSVLALLRRAHGGPQDLTADLERAGLRPLTGGRNNTVYAWAPPGAATTCIKLYRVDDRRRLDREWAALTHINALHPGDAPTPLWHDLAGPLPAVGMSFVPGTPLPDLDAAERRQALKALAHAHSRIHELPLPAPLTDLERIDSLPHYARRLTDLWPEQLARAAHDPLTPRMFALLEEWKRHGDHQTAHEPAERPVFSRGDSNLLNWL